jgi:hypothetical protein
MISYKTLLKATMPRSIPRLINRIRRRLKFQRDLFEPDLIDLLKTYEDIMYKN